MNKREPISEKPTEPDHIPDAGKMVPVEPVGWVNSLTDPHPRFVTSLNFRTLAEVEAGVEFLPVYAAPQPAPDAADLVELLENIELWFQRQAVVAHRTARAARKAIDAYRKQGG